MFFLVALFINMKTLTVLLFFCSLSKIRCTKLDLLHDIWKFYGAYLTCMCFWSQKGAAKASRLIPWQRCALAMPVCMSFWTWAANRAVTAKECLTYGIKIPLKTFLNLKVRVFGLFVLFCFVFCFVFVLFCFVLFCFVLFCFVLFCFVFVFVFWFCFVFVFCFSGCFLFWFFFFFKFCPFN